MEEDKPIMNRLLRAIADSENDRPSDDSHVVDLSRKDALDAVKRITDLHIMASEYATALYELKPDHPLFPTNWEEWKPAEQSQ